MHVQRPCNNPMIRGMTGPAGYTQSNNSSALSAAASTPLHDTISCKDYGLRGVCTPRLENELQPRIHNFRSRPPTSRKREYSSTWLGQISSWKSAASCNPESLLGQFLSGIHRISSGPTQHMPKTCASFERRTFDFASASHRNLAAATHSNLLKHKRG
jgi:hypothetical protein